MSSILKTSLTADTSLLNQGDAADATDILPAVADLLNHNKAGRLAVSSGDTHVKHLENALTVGSGLAITKINPGADENLRLDIDVLVLVTLTGIQTLTNKTLTTPYIGDFTNAVHPHQNPASGGQLNASNVFSAGTVPGARGGLGANAAAFTGLLKMTAGVASVATADTDYVTPSGTATLSNKTMNAGEGNAIHLGALAQSGAATNDIPIWNGSGWSPGAQGGGGAQPVDITVTAGETLAQRDNVFLDRSNNKWYKIDTNAVPIKLSDMRGVVQSASIAADADGTVRQIGEVTGYTGLTAWQPVYASTTPGGYTQTKPTVTAGGGQVAIVPVGIATSTTKVLTMQGKIKYLKRENIAHNATATITHHTDAQGRERDIKAYVSSTAAGLSAASYASSNQDSNVGLSKRTVATYTVDQCTGGTATASSFISATYTPEKGFDDTNSTYWHSNTTNTVASPVWLEYQFAVSKTIRQYTVRASNSASMGDRSPNEFKLQYYDGATWQDADSRVGQTWTSNEQKVYPVANSYSSTRWRIYVSRVTDATGSDYCEIAELEMMGIATYTNGANQLAQSFQIASTGTVDGVILWLKKVGSTVGTMTLRIETDSAGSPSGTLADANATITVAESSLSASYGSILFDFASNFSLTGSTTYWLRLSTSRSVDEFNYVDWGADGSSAGYASGEMKSYIASWAAESKDAIFDVVAPGVVYDGQCSLGTWLETSPWVINRYDDGAGANGDTQTTFKNISSATRDLTFVVELN